MRSGVLPAVISVIICARNEAGGIGRLIASVKPYYEEIVVVDGHSKDETAALAEQAGARVVLDNGRGKGDAYQVGIRETTGEIQVFMDADGSHDPAEIPDIIRPIEQDLADLVIGSRHRGGSDEWQGDLTTWLRAIGSGFLSVVINARWKSNLTDVLNGFRAARRSAAGAAAGEARRHRGGPEAAPAHALLRIRHRRQRGRGDRVGPAAL